MIEYKSIIAAPYGPVKSLLWDFQRCEYMVTYRFYLDESGTDSKPRFATVAGCMMSINDWAELYPKWADVLREYGLSYFHAGEILARKHPDRVLSDEYIRALFCDLRNLIAEREYGIWWAIVNKNDFGSTAVFFPEVRSRLTIMEFLVYGSIVSSPLLMKKVGEDGLIGCVFESGGEALGPFVGAIIDACESRMGCFEKPLSYEDKKKSIGLQAADYVAWHYNRHMHTTFQDGRLPDLPFFDMMNPGDNRRFLGAAYGPGKLEYLFRFMNGFLPVYEEVLRRRKLNS